MGKKSCQTVLAAPSMFGYVEKPYCPPVCVPPPCNPCLVPIKKPCYPCPPCPPTCVPCKPCPSPCDPCGDRQGKQGPQGFTGPGGTFSTLGSLTDVTFTPDPLTIAELGNYLFFDGANWINAGSNNIGIGTVIPTGSAGAIAIGSGALSTAASTIALGPGATSSGTEGIAIGLGAVNETLGSVVVGSSTGTSLGNGNNNTTIVGTNATAGVGSAQTIIGYNAIGGGTGSTTVGVLSSSGAEGVVIGHNSSGGANSVVLGSGLVTAGLDDVVVAGVAALPVAQFDIDIATTLNRRISALASAAFHTGAQLLPAGGPTTNTSWAVAAGVVNVMTYNPTTGEMSYVPVTLS